jgi:hypothetical protein
MSTELILTQGGLKKIALSGFSPMALKLFCYLLDSLAQDVSDVVTNLADLGAQFGVAEKDVQAALDELANAHVLQLIKKNQNVYLLKLVPKLELWNLPLNSNGDRKNANRLGSAENLSLFSPKTGLPGQEPIQFPMELKGNHPLRALSGGRNLEDPSDVEFKQQELSTSLVEKFKTISRYKLIDLEKELAFSKMLLEDQPIEKVIELLDAFGEDLKSLGLLVGGWQHYEDLLKKRKKDVQQLLDYRKRQEQANARLRESVQLEIKKWENSKKSLSADESFLLQILLHHEQPRRQFFWALQAKNRYPQLWDFFQQNSILAQSEKNHK